MQIKACIVGMSIVALSFFAGYFAKPVSADTVKLLPPNLDGEPSGFPDDQSAMPCCSVETKKHEIEHYKIGDDQMCVEMQDFVHSVCVENGIEFYYPYFICQIYQESKFNPNAVSSNGLDYGYCQLRATYHEYFKNLVGHPEWDLINDPYANVYTGCFIMAMYLEDSGFDIPTALKKYYNSGSEYWNNKYVEDVLQWYPHLERI